MIVKKIYFHNEIYSDNEKQFIKILTEFGLIWVKSVEKKYGQYLTGIYSSSDQSKKLLAIYEGYKKPATMVLKVAGSGGNFVLSLVQFCYKIGCDIEDKDEIFINDLLLRLKEHEDINVEKPEDLEKRKLEEIHAYIDDKVSEFIHVKQDYLLRNNIPFDIAKKFKKWDLENDIMWAIDNDLINI